MLVHALEIISFEDCCTYELFFPFARDGIARLPRDSCFLEILGKEFHSKFATKQTQSIGTSDNEGEL